MLLCIGKFIAGTIFRKECLEQFYELKTDPHFEVSIEVKNAYIEFLKDFCKYVSPYWSTYIKLDKMKVNKDKFGFKANLTVSDEAIAIWLIKHNYDTAYNNSLEINRLTEAIWKEQRVKRKHGKHDSKLHYDDYKKIFNKIKTGRNHKDTLTYWESIFFEGFYEFNTLSSDSNENLEELDGFDETFEDVEVLEM